MIYLRSLIFTILLFLSVFPFSFAVILAAPAGLSASYYFAAMWAKFNMWSLRTICGLCYRVEGADNIPAQNGVIYVKHSSAFETMVQFVVFPAQACVLKRELMWIPIMGWALALIKPIAIDRKAHGSAVRQVIRHGRHRLDAGLWVVIFPEGTRMPPGETRRYGLSGAVLAAETGRPLLPVAHNAGDFWPRRGLRKRSGTIRVVIGPAIDPAGKTPHAINAEAQTWIEATMREISEAYQPETRASDTE